MEAEEREVSPRLVSVEGQLSDLERMRRELEAVLADVNAKLSRLKKSADEVEPSANGVGRSTVAAGRRGRPVRAVLLDSLEDLGWPAYTRELALYCEARYGRKIPPTRFGTLAADEVEAYRKSDGKSRPVWLCFALTHDRHEPIKRLLARSDWPVDRRIHGPTTGRIQHLWITNRLCELALRVDDYAADAEMLRIIAADHARDLPGVTVRRGEFDLPLWRQVAGELLADLGPRDEEMRRESADRLAKRSQFFQLFGVPDVIEGFRNEPRVERDRA